MAKAQPQPGMNRFYLLLGVGALVGAALLYYVTQRKTVSIPANVAVLAADTAGFRGYVVGSDSARVEISEYADYQCPGCQQFEAMQWPTVQEQLIATGQVRWRYRDLPLDIHPHSRVAAHAAACANDQGKFWEMKAKIYEHQAEWSPMKSAAGEFARYAGEVGLNAGQYNECMQSAKYAGRIQASYDEAAKLGVASTPSFLIGGRLYAGAIGSDSVRALVQALLAAPR